MLSRTIYKKRRGRNWLTGLAILSLLTGSFVVSSTALAVLDRDLFELDKDATNDTEYEKVGVLNAALSSTATSVQICQAPATFADGTLILVDAERITLSNGASAAGGGCPSLFPLKHNYTAARAQGGTAAGAHAKGEDVSLITTGAFNGDDWDQVYDEVVADPDTKCESLGAVECVFVSDGRAMSIFTQSKDYDEISNEQGATAFWQWRDQSVPDADELDDGFAIKYVNGQDEQHLYFGADRFAVNGTKDAGFWFFHDDVAPVPPANGGDGTFTGLHTAPTDGGDGFCNGDSGGGAPSGGQPSPVPACDYDDNDTGGDVLILTTFTGGGAVTTVRVFEWVGPAGSTAALLERGAASDCVPGDATQELCATVNDTTIETAWPYSGKSEPANNEVASGGLLEGGVNLTDLGLEGCFSSFMATSRSSASLTADPKDFILGSFEACDTEVTTTPSDGAGNPLVDSNANDIPDIQIGTGAAGVDVSDALLLDVQGTTTFTGSLNFFLCGPIAQGETCDEDGVEIGAAAGTNPVTANGTYFSATANLTEVGYYCWRGEFDSDTDGVPGDTDASEGECFEVLPVQPTLDTQAWSSGDDQGSAQTDPVPFGQPLYDKASLFGTAYQPGTDGAGDANGDYKSINATMDTPANGSITFTLIGPDDCSTTASGTGDNPESGVTVTGDGDYFSSGFTPALPGDYHWQATYSSDDPNTLSASHNDDCSDTDEDVTVEQLQPTMDTAQNFVPNDSATISVAGGTGDLDGDVTFYLWVNDDTCGAGDLGTADDSFGPFSIFADDDGTDPLTDSVDSDNTTAYDVDGTTFHWIAVFTSNNDAHLGVTSGCGNEFSSIAIDNGVTQPTTP